MPYIETTMGNKLVDHTVYNALRNKFEKEFIAQQSSASANNVDDKINALNDQIKTLSGNLSDYIKKSQFNDENQYVTLKDSIDIPSTFDERIGIILQNKTVIVVKDDYSDDLSALNHIDQCPYYFVPNYGLITLLEGLGFKIKEFDCVSDVSNKLRIPIDEDSIYNINDHTSENGDVITKDIMDIIKGLLYKYPNAKQ